MALDDPAPAERIGVLLGRLHPITRLIVAAGVLHLCGDLLAGAMNLLQYRDMVLTGSEASLARVLADIAHGVAYGLSFFGTAATVEFLVRIWGEVKAMRGQGDKAG